MNTDKFGEGGRRSLNASRIRGVDSTEAEYITNLTALAKTGKMDPVIGRDEETRRLIAILLHRRRNNSILVGERGVGKTSIVKGLAQRIIAGDVPSILANWRILSLNLSSLSSEVVSREKLEERTNRILKEIEDSKVVSCLFIDDPHLLSSAEENGGLLKISNLLKAIFAKGKLHRCIVTTTPAELQNFKEKNMILEEQFIQIPIAEPTSRDAASMLRGLKTSWEIHYGIQISDDAVREAVELSGHNLPQSAIDLIDATLAHVQLTAESGPETLGSMERKNKQLGDEIQGLEQDTSESSAQYLAEAKQEQIKLQKNLKPLQQLYENVQALTEEINTMTSKLETTKSNLANAEKHGDIMKAADLKYYVVPELEEKLKQLKSDKDKASSALSNQALNEASKVFFTQVITSTQVRKMADKIDSERNHLPRSDFTSKATALMGSSELLASDIRETATELPDPETPAVTSTNQTLDQRSEMPSFDKHLEPSELSTHQNPPELSDTSRMELEGVTTHDMQELNDTSKVELEASAPSPRYELATNPIRGNIELESLERHEVPAADVQRRPELEGSWVPDLPELGDENSKVDGDATGEKMVKEKGRWKGKLKGLIFKGK
jgi:ATP-dependent Clp protease ATP-binding subunit ClpA